jgi:hypothetical protein
MTSKPKYIVGLYLSMLADAVGGSHELMHWWVLFIKWLYWFLPRNGGAFYLPTASLFKSRANGRDKNLAPEVSFHPRSPPSFLWCYINFHLLGWRKLWSKFHRMLVLLGAEEAIRIQAPRTSPPTNCMHALLYIALVVNNSTSVGCLSSRHAGQSRVHFKCI